MKLLNVLSIALAALLFSASSVLAQVADPAIEDQYEPPSGEIITGVVSEVSPDGSSVIVSDGNSLYDMAITPETRFVDGVVYTPEDTPPRGPTARDLAPGLEVEIRHSGVLAQSYPAQGEALRVTFLSPWYEEGDGTVQETFRGYLTSVTDGEIRVQQNPDATVEDPGYCDQTLDFTLSDETEISGSLAVGQQVEVVYLYDPDGVYTLQCPGKFPAASVTVMSDEGGDGNGGSDGETPGGSPGGETSSGGTNAGGSVASDVYTVLPDTGGPTIVGMVVTLTAITLLVAIYRATSRE